MKEVGIHNSFSVSSAHTFKLLFGRLFYIQTDYLSDYVWYIGEDYYKRLSSECTFDFSTGIALWSRHRFLLDIRLDLWDVTLYIYNKDNPMITSGSPKYSWEYKPGLFVRLLM